MKLWDVLATCLLLLSSVSTRPIFPKLQPVKRPPVVGLHHDSATLSVEDSFIHPYSHPQRLHQTSMEEQCKCFAFPTHSYIHQISSNSGIDKSQSVMEILMLLCFTHKDSHISLRALLRIVTHSYRN